MPDREKVIEYCEAVLALLKEQQKQIDRLIEESASNAEMAEGLKALLQEQENEKKRNPVIVCPHCGKRVK